MPLTDAWRFCLGLSIIVMVLAFPGGLSGVGDVWRGWRDRRTAVAASEAAE
jgi:hypothetical protein